MPWYGWLAVGFGAGLVSATILFIAGVIWICYDEWDGGL